MAIEKQQEINESRLTLFSKQLHNQIDNYCFVESATFNSSGSAPSTDAIIIIDDDEEEKVTLEPKKKKRRLGSWWENVEPFDELICVVKGSRKAKEDSDVASRASSCYSSTDLNETNTNEKNHDDEKSLPKKKNDESVAESNTRRKRKKDYEHVSLEDLEVSMEDLKSIPWESFDTKPNEKNDDEGSLQKKKKDEIVGEIITTTRNKKKDYEHVSLEDLEVSMEDLKSIPWESFDTTWEIRSDPWFNAYTEDQLLVSL